VNKWPTAFLLIVTTKFLRRANIRQRFRAVEHLAHARFGVELDNYAYMSKSFSLNLLKRREIRELKRTSSRLLGNRPSGLLADNGQRGNGSAVLNMAIAVGAILPALRGAIADQIGLQHAFFVLVICHL
jgi:hypothetical protein